MAFPFSFKGPELLTPSSTKRIDVVSYQGRLIGAAELFIGKVRQITYAFIYYIEIRPAFRGQGICGQLLQEVNKFLEESRRLGLLQNFLNAPDSTYNFYEHYGWLPIPWQGRKKWMYYPSREIDSKLFPQLIFDAQRRAQRIINKL